MPYQVNETCYDSVESAVAAVGAEQDGNLVNIGTAAYSVNVVSTTGSLVNYRLTNLSTGAVTARAVSVYPQPCVLQVSNPFQLSLAEGSLIASAVLAVWALGYGFRAVIRTFNSDVQSTLENES